MIGSKIVSSSPSVAVTAEAKGSTSGGGALSGTITNKPIVPGTLVFSDGTNTIVDNGSGVLVGTPAGAGTIDYNTGAFSITGGAASAAVSAGYQTWQGADGSFFNYISNTGAPATARLKVNGEDGSFVVTASDTGKDGSWVTVFAGRLQAWAKANLGSIAFKSIRVQATAAARIEIVQFDNI